MNIEVLKKKIVQVDKDIAISKNDLNRFFKELKKDFDIIPSQVGRHLVRLSKQGKRLAREKKNLYSEAEEILEGIE